MCDISKNCLHIVNIARTLIFFFVCIVFSDIKEVKDSLGFSNLNYINGLQDNVSKELRAAQVHGQVMNDDVIRRPVRLGALPAVGVMGKKPKKKKGGLDPF